MSCKKIATNRLINCANPMVAGVDDELILINFDDIDGITRNVTNPQIIEGITLASGATAFRYEGKNNSNETDSNLVKKKYAEVYDHIVKFKVFENGSEVKKELENMIGGKMVAIIRNNYKANDSQWEVFGIDTGLFVKTATRNAMDQETQGAYAVELMTSDVVKEPHLPSTFFITDYATTETAINSLL